MQRLPAVRRKGNYVIEIGNLFYEIFVKLKLIYYCC